MYLRSLSLIFVLSIAHGQDRKITPTLNPGCQTCNSNNTLVYIVAEGPHDAIHQVWDFTRGHPTVIYAITRLNTSMNIHWVDTVPIRFSFSERPSYSFAATVDKITEYDDLDDNGHISSKSPQRSLSMRHTSWTLKDSIFTEKEVMIQMHGEYKDQWRTGLMDVKLDLLPFVDYAVDLPHLIHTANSTLVDMTLVNFTTSDRFNASRFAVHFVLASTDSRRDSMNYTMRKSLDDEHTPGVFEIIEIKTPRSSKSNDGGFIQFRPVGYTEAERSVSSSTNAYISNFNRTSLPRSSTIGTFYHDADEANLLVEDLFVSFGLPGDGYYKQHNFTAWSFTIGYGAPPVESFSLFVIIIISIGLGVPVLLALSGITYVLIRRYKQRNAPARFRNDE